MYARVGERLVDLLLPHTKNNHWDLHRYEWDTAAGLVGHGTINLLTPLLREGSRQFVHWPWLQSCWNFWHSTVGADPGGTGGDLIRNGRLPFR